MIVEEGDGGDCHDDEGSHDDVVAIPPSLFPAIAMEIHRIDPGVISDNGQVLLDQLDEVKSDLTKIIEKKGISVVDLSLVSVSALQEDDVSQLSSLSYDSVDVLRRSRRICWCPTSTQGYFSSEVWTGCSMAKETSGENDKEVLVK